MLWIGERTRQLDGAHVEFLRGVGNPIGCKIGPTTDARRACSRCARRSTPTASPAGSRSSPGWAPTRSRTRLPPAAARPSRDAGHPVVWACDPMHGNTFTAPSGRKTRALRRHPRRDRRLLRAHRAEGTWPGGIHVELTGDDVTECLGGAEEILDADLDDRYETMCDPRLNGRQSLDLAFRVAELLRASPAWPEPHDDGASTLTARPGRSANVAAAVVAPDGDGRRPSATPTAPFRLASIDQAARPRGRRWSPSRRASSRSTTPVGQPGCTLRHLLAHAGGYPFDGAEPIARPARARIYSNTGIELAADARRRGRRRCRSPTTSPRRCSSRSA